MTAPAKSVRVRFAPSPTGYFHVGGARTALYNWAFARQQGGVLVLRIEDTDTERNREEWVRGILDALTWIGAVWDEGPYRQSERRAAYDGAADRLWEAGRLYACDCTREAVLERTKSNPVPGYDGYCRHRGLERGPGRALRFAVPDSGTTVVRDLIRGDVEFSNETIEDFVIVRSNGQPLFVFAVVIDDRDMEISHVIRGEEHLPTTPKALLIWSALNQVAEHREFPLFAHLPVIVNEKRQKLSKRRDRVALEDFEADGYLSEAMANYLVLLGWSPPTGEEFFTLDDLVREFRLDDVNDAPAFFDTKKLLHFNGVYLRRLEDEDFTARVREWSERANDPLGTEVYATPEWKALAPLVRERVALLSEVPKYVEFLFGHRFEIDTESFAKAIARDDLAPSLLRESREGFAALGEWRAELLKEVLEGVAVANERKLGKAQAPVRVATLGRTVGLPLFESLEVLGREETIRRLDATIERV